MSNQNLENAILSFFEEIPKYYGYKTEISEGLITDIQNFNAKTTTWNLSEFSLIRSAYRVEGNRFMMEGSKMYYEIAAEHIISLKKTGNNAYEFIEQYSINVFRMTKICFLE